MILRKVFVLAYNDNGTIKLFHPVANTDCNNIIKEYYNSEEEAVSAWEAYKLENEWSAPDGVFLLTEYRIF